MVQVAHRCSKKRKKGDKRINIERAEQALETHADIVAAACPFCNTMMVDGIKSKKQEESVVVKDIAELIAESLN